MKEFVMSNRNYRIAPIPGDGIGKEVIPAAVKVLQTAAMVLEERFSLFFEEFDWGCECYAARA
jgi:tartrate dehydrogenase/decarboxylase/D-malate dehydrogenase